MLYLPESFEWLILKSGIVHNAKLADILERPEEYIDSAKYFSWEQFFTELLIQQTSEQDYMRYGKQSLPPFYLQAENIRKVISSMERD